MVLRETAAFQRQVGALLSDAEYRELQLHLVAWPDAGSLIRGMGGVRKLRWGAKGRGKRGGVRVIYYWNVDQARIYLLVMYDKTQKDDLSEAEKDMLRKLVAKD